MTSVYLDSTQLSKNKLPQKFYQRDTLLIAKELLGKIIVKKFCGKILAAKIVETEAYTQKDDEAAHSFNGITKRNEVMFNPGGFLYVYFTYGMHFCSNVVTGNSGEGNAVLIRAVEPLTEFELIKQNRGNKNFIIKDLTNGPAKFCQAFSINLNDNGTSLISSDIFISNFNNIPYDQIITTTRIGIKKSVNFPRRFYIKNNEFISKK